MQIVLENVNKYFISDNEKIEVLKDINFHLTKGQMIGIKGENGSGKTTLLNILARLTEPSSGKALFYKNKEANLTRGVVFQDFNSSLLPWCSIEKNIKLPLLLKNKLASNNIFFNEILDLIKIDNSLLKKYPHELSGGQKQKVTIARSLLQKPDILIFDEPFSNLDFKTIIELQQSIQKYILEKEISLIMVSHDIDHLLFFVDELFILKGLPATLQKKFEIPFSKPREKNLIKMNEYKELRNSIIEYQYGFD